MTIQLGILKAIIDSEDNPLRFERFCIDLFSATEGIEIVSTSKTWDLGRDGRSIGRVEGVFNAVLLATLEEDIDKKVQSDISRLKDTTITKRIIFCASQKLSEKKITEIESSINKLYPHTATIQANGQYQLMTLASRHEDIFRNYYNAEISNIELTFSQTAIDTEEAKIGLRLALLTHESEDSAILRKELAKLLISNTLFNKAPMTPEQVGIVITSQLHLPRSISSNFTRELLYQLQDEGVVIEENDKFQLTSSGEENIRNIPEEASYRLLEGRIAIRKAIESLIGKKMADMHYEKIWSAFQDNITGLFYNHGLAIVKMIRSALSEETWSSEKALHEIPLDEFAEKVAFETQPPDLKEEIQQAIVDLFAERDSEAFKWLTQVCGIYVMMCTLGFETLSNQQIIKVLSCYHLVPDSDIVISLLCEGEENHNEVERILQGWKSIGGVLYMVKPILEEVAYHAWISEYDYNLFEDRLSQISDNESRRLIDNAFVRSFRKEAGGQTNRVNWNQYIKQYRGRSDLDHIYIQDHLSTEYGFGIIPELDDATEDFTDKLFKHTITRLCKQMNCQTNELDRKLIGKVRRDSRLINLVYLQREKARAERMQKTFCIISSAKLIKDVDNLFRNKLGLPEMVLSLSAIGFLLTLTPQVQMGFSTLKAILFDTIIYTRLSSMQKFAYSIISSTGKWDVPFSRRPMLQRELQNTLYEQAKALGKPVKEVKEDFFKPVNAESSALIISTVLDKMAIHPKSEMKAQALEQLVKQLQERLTRQKEIPKNRPIYQKQKLKQFRKKKR